MMRLREGLGPVFAWEWAAATRRWQTYAARALFVGGLLAGLIVVRWGNGTDLDLSTNAQAALGRWFFYAIVGTQLVLVMLAAPAATAGAICIERARGTLDHMLVTDLTSREIVLGKLAARLTPVLTLVACSMPVLLLTTLLGGVDPTALAGAFAVILGVTVAGCALALTLSVWVGKAHEVLMATYLALIVLPLAPPAWWGLGFGTSPNWLRKADPFWLAFGPYNDPGSVGLIDCLAFAALALALSAGLVTLAVLRLRTSGSRRVAPRRRRTWGRMSPWTRQAAQRLRSSVNRWAGRLPGPTLDGNPVLWREWHRKRPSRWTLGLWTIYYGVTLLFSLMAAWATLTMRGNASAGFAAWVNGLQASVGFLLLSVSAATALAEERQRGSLDILLTTPLPTRAIVWGKWLGVYRMVPSLTLLPVLIAIAGWRADRWWVPPLLAAFLLALGAALTSVGLALATWISRLGRALASTVAIYVFLAVGWLFLVLAVASGAERDNEGIMGATPFYGSGMLTFILWEPAQSRRNFASWMVFWVFAYSAIAAGLLAATLRTFDRCLGRSTMVTPARPRQDGRQPASSVADALVPGFSDD